MQPRPSWTRLAQPEAGDLSRLVAGADVRLDGEGLRAGLSGGSVNLEAGGSRVLTKLDPKKKK